MKSKILPAETELVSPKKEHPILLRQFCLITSVAKYGGLALLLIGLKGVMEIRASSGQKPRNTLFFFTMGLIPASPATG